MVEAFFDGVKQMEQFWESLNGWFEGGALQALIDTLLIALHRSDADHPLCPSGHPIPDQAP